MLCKLDTFTQHVSPTLNGSSALQRFERGNAIEICYGIMFDLYPGLPHMHAYNAPYFHFYQSSDSKTNLAAKVSRFVTLTMPTH